MDLHYFNKFSQALSIERINEYGRDGADELTVLARYLHNMALCETLYSSLQFAEVSLRNAFHEALCKRYGSNYLFSNAFRDNLHKGNLAQLENTTKQLNKQFPDQAIVASDLLPKMHFGFWTAFLQGSYQKSGLSFYLIQSSFVGTCKRERNIKLQHKTWDKIRRLRNSVFHNERIIHWKDLQEQHQIVLQAIGWISPELLELAKLIDKFSDVYAKDLAEWKKEIRSHWPADKR